MNRSYFSAKISEFLDQEANTILGKMIGAHGFDLDNLQRDTWVEQIRTLKDQLIGLDGSINFDFAIPRMGKQIDLMGTIDSIVFCDWVKDYLVAKLL